MLTFDKSPFEIHSTIPAVKCQEFCSAFGTEATLRTGQMEMSMLSENLHEQHYHCGAASGHQERQHKQLERSSTQSSHTSASWRHLRNLGKPSEDYECL